MTRRWLMNVGEGRDLVRASATILCVCEGMSFAKTSLDEFAHEITADVNVKRKNLAQRIFTHGNTGQIILIDFSCILLLITKIFEGFTKIMSLLPGLAGGDEFGFGGRQRKIVWTATFPRHGSVTHHKNLASV